MDWIDEKITAWRKRTKDSQAITQSAYKMFVQVWEGINEIIEYLVGKGIMLLETNGSPRNRMVIMGVLPHPAETDVRRKLNLTLASNLRSITATSDAGSTILNIEVSPDGLVCLKHQGREVTTQDAAREIMEPFLFSGKSPYFS